MLLKSCQVVGVDWGGWSSRDPAGNRQLLVDVTAMIEAGTVSPFRPTTYPFEQAAEALTALTERRLAGKAALVTR